MSTLNVCGGWGFVDHGSVGNEGVGCIFFWRCLECGLYLF